MRFLYSFCLLFYQQQKFIGVVIFGGLSSPSPIGNFAYAFSTDPILTECIDVQSIRVNYYPTSDISQLFHKVHI